MTNPFLSDLGMGNSQDSAKDDSSNSNPFLADLSIQYDPKSKIEKAKHKAILNNNKDQIELNKPDDPTLLNAAKNIANSFTAGALNLPNNILATATKYIPNEYMKHSLGEVSRKLNDFIDTISPNPNNPYSTSSNIAETLSGTTGDFITQGKAFGLINKGISSASNIGTSTSLTKNALLAIDATAKKISESLIQRGVSENLANTLGQTIKQAPQQLAASTILQGIQDPESLSTLKGSALAIGFGLLGSLTEGHVKAKDITKEIANSKSPGEIQESLDALNNIKKEIDNHINDPSQLPNSIQAAYKRLNNATDAATKAGIERLSKMKSGDYETYPILTKGDEPVDPRLIKIVTELRDRNAIEVINPIGAKGSRASDALTLDLPPGSKTANLNPEPVNRPSILTGDDINNAYRQSVADYNQKLNDISNNSMSKWSISDLMQHADDLNKFGHYLDNGIPQLVIPSDSPTRQSMSSLQATTLGPIDQSDFSNLGASTPIAPPNNSNISPQPIRIPYGDITGNTKPNIINAINFNRKLNAEFGDPIESNSTDLHPSIVKDVGVYKTLPSLTELYNKVIFNTVDKLKYFKNIDKLTPDLPDNQKVGVISQLSNGSAGRADQFLTSRPFSVDEDGNPIFSSNKGYKDILTPLEGKLDEYRNAMVAINVINGKNFNADNVLNTMSSNEANKILANSSPEVEQAVKETQLFKSDVSNYMKDKGLFTNKTLDTWNKLTNLGVSLESAGQGISKVIKDPILSIIEQTRSGIKAADKNEIGLTLANAALKEPKKFIGIIEPLGYADKINSPKIYATADNIVNAAKKVGHDISIDDAIELSSSMLHQLDENSNTLHIFRDGLIEKYRVSPEIAATYKAMSPESFQWYTKLLGIPAKLLKSGTVETPLFGMFNFIKDAFDAKLQSKYGYTLNDSFNGLIESIKNGEAKQRFMAGGGGMSSISSSNSDATLMRMITPKNNTQSVIQTITHPLELMKNLSRPLEEAARLGEFMRAEKAGASNITATLAGRTVTTDFGQIGASMAAWSHITAFFNPALQSLIKNGATFKEAPFRTTSLGLSSLSLPSAMLWAANYGDQEINDLRKTPDGSMYWYIRTNDNTIMKFPKPFIYGQIFATGIEDALDSMMDKDENSMHNWAKSVRDAAMFTMIPNSVQTSLNLARNQDSFSGSTIVPTGLQNVIGPAQTNSNTSELTKKISSDLYQVSNGYINISPIQFDYIIKQTTGGLGSDVNKTISKVIGTDKHGPSNTLSDLPVVGRLFARYPSQSVEPVRTFYDGVRDTETITNTLANYLKTNQIDKYTNYLNKNKEALAIAPIYAEAKAQVNSINKTIAEINNLPDSSYSPEEKRNKNDMLLHTIILITRTTNNSVSHIRKQINNNQ